MGATQAKSVKSHKQVLNTQYKLIPEILKLRTCQFTDGVGHL